MIAAGTIQPRFIKMAAGVVNTMSELKKNPDVRIVKELPDLMLPEDYGEGLERKRIRIRLSLKDSGVEILGDSLYVEKLENLLALLEPSYVERTLCG